MFFVKLSFLIVKEKSLTKTLVNTKKFDDQTLQKRKV